MEIITEVVEYVFAIMKKTKYTPGEFFGMIMVMVILTPPISWVWDKVLENKSKLKIRKNGSTKN